MTCQAKRPRRKPPPEREPPPIVELRTSPNLTPERREAALDALADLVNYVLTSHH